MTGSNTRVGIPLHAVAIRRIGDLVATEPEFYDRLCECFPQIDAQRRWWKDSRIVNALEYLIYSFYKFVSPGSNWFFEIGYTFIICFKLSD